MFCLKCGNKILDNAMFCSNCGEKLPAVDGRKGIITITDSVAKIDSHDSHVNIGQQILYQGQSEQTGKLCPFCDSSVTKNKLRTCKSCKETYCSYCDILGTACPHCGNTPQLLSKLKCGSCKGVFGIPLNDKNIIEHLDKDTTHSVKQRCACPICGKTAYYSGSVGFQDMGLYTPQEILQNFHDTSLTVTTLKDFKSE